MRSKKLNVSEVAEVSPLIEKLIGDIWLGIESDQEVIKELDPDTHYLLINVYKRNINSKYHKIQGLEKIYSWINNKELLVIEREEN